MAIGYLTETITSISWIEPIRTAPLSHERHSWNSALFSFRVQLWLTAQTPRSKLYSAIAEVFRSAYRPTFLLRTALACVWEQILFRPQNPRIVLLDEPTEGIQLSIIDEIIDQLKAIRARRGLTVLLVEQNMDFIKELSDRVLLIQKGAIKNEFSADALTAAAAMGDFSGVAH
jgi:hypothetical protein